MIQDCILPDKVDGKPFLFISYSHENTQGLNQILPILRRNHFRFWYDRGIRSGVEWAAEIEHNVTNCSQLLVLMTPQAVESSFVRREISLATSLHKKILVLYLSDTTLTNGLGLLLAGIQVLYLSSFSDSFSFEKELCDTLEKEIRYGPSSQEQPGAPALFPAQKAIKLNVNRIRRDLQDETFLAGKQAYANCDFKQAMDLYRTAYFGGNSTAGTLLAKMYYYGHYCPQDYDRAAQIFIDCMHRDNPLAAEEIAYCYLYGHGVPKDKEKACAIFACCRDALEDMAILGSSNAQYALGYDILYGKFTAPTPERGVYWLQKAAESGSNVAMFHLAKARLTGNGCPKDRDTAVRELNHCKNDPHCAYLIANLMQKGIEGIKQNDSTAFEFLLAASQKDHTQAQSDLGDCYYQGKGTHVDYAQAVFWYQKAADKGDLYSIGHLGMQYLLAEGVPKDIEKAISFFTTADKKNGGYGARMLGYIYCGLYDGEKSYKDLPKAVRCLQRGADRGDNPALEKLLECYYGEFGKEIQNLPLYCALLEEASKTNRAAAYELGNYCLDNHTYGLDALEALKPWADLQDPTATYLMGRIYRNGIGVPKDRTKAKALLRKAADLGSKEAAAELRTFWF